MIKHIVMWRLKEAGSEKGKNANALKARLEALRQAIPQIVSLEVGIDINRTDAAADVVLVTEFESMADLGAYQKHPEHLKVADFLAGIAAERRVVDYEA